MIIVDRSCLDTPTIDEAVASGSFKQTYLGGNILSDRIGRNCGIYVVVEVY